jgi:hypothetical protein
MHHALPPSEPPDGERPRCLCLMTTSSVVGRSKPGCGLCPALSFKDLHHPCCGGGRAEPGPASAWASDALLPPASGEEDILQLCGGGILQPCGGRRTAAAWPGCSIPSSARATVAGCTGGSHNTSYAARAVLVFWDGPVLVLVARTGVRTCRCALERPSLAGAVLVGRWPLSSVLRWWLPLERLPTAAVAAFAGETVSATCAPGLRLFGFNGWFSSPARGREGLSAAAFSLRPSLQLSCRLRRRSLSLLQWLAASHLEFVIPQGLWCGCCSHPREWNRSSVCNGTLSAGVCSLWLSRPEHLGI